MELKSIGDTYSIAHKKGIVNTLGRRVVYMLFCIKLRNAREEKGMTQGELAAEVGISQSALAQYETGAKAPNVILAGRIADVLGVTVDSLLKE